MVSAFDSGSSGPGSSPGRGHCVVYLSNNDNDNDNNNNNNNNH